MMVVEPKKRSFNDLLMVIYICSIGFRYRLQIQSNAARVCFGILLFAAVIFAKSLSSFLMANTANTIYRPQINTIDEIVQQNFSLAGDQFALDKLMQQNEVIGSLNILTYIKIYIELPDFIFIQITEPITIFPAPISNCIRSI